MINKKHLRQIIASVLKALGLYSKEAEDLIFGTACVESDCGNYRKQINGPALSIYQIEPATLKDVYENFLNYRPELLAKVEALRYKNLSKEDNLINNDEYATAICRVIYLRAKGAIPKTIPGQAQYWKDVYNTASGKGTVRKYMEKWHIYNGGGLDE